MALIIDEILDVLRARGIEPGDEIEGTDLPGIGAVEEGETIYSSSITEIFPKEDSESPESLDIFHDDRLNDWWREIEQIIETKGSHRTFEGPDSGQYREPPEPHCAWYCPIHFFGHSWGIYIRESCILSSAKEIARFVDWRAVQQPFRRRGSITRQLLRSAFYVFYLHEQFHHKVESLGFRLLIATGTDRYRPYKANVYRPSYLTPDCLEESLANAESYRRLSEPRYAKRHDKPILAGLRNFLRWSFPLQPAGYAESINFLADQDYRNGLYALQSQALDGTIPPKTPPLDWSVAPNIITSLMDIADDIYVVLPRGARPIFKPTSIDPGATVSSRALVGALTRHHGYQKTSGGKGSHVKLTKPGAPNIHIPGDRPVVSPGVVKQALGAIGGYSISRLPDLLEGRLTK
jgi:predicted RNA binding protein YcfA (HicA-like mRNA interferase family)